MTEPFGRGLALQLMLPMKSAITASYFPCFCAVRLSTLETFILCELAMFATVCWPVDST